jgi:hypothetical protein
MRRRISLSITWIALIAYCFSASASTVLAASSTTSTPTADNGQALEIAPPVIYISVNPGQTLTTQILIRDISSGDLIVAGQANDFVASGEDGTPKILLNNNDSNNPYTLKNWVAPLPNLLLIPRQIKSMTVTLNVPANASPGGHYGVIRFTATPPSLQGSGVSLSASLGALMLVTVSGKITEGLTVSQFSVNNGGKSGSFFQSGPLNFVEALKNTGNVHVQPIGQVSITDMFGKKLAAVNVNLPPGNILPQSIRKFQQPLDKTVIGNKRLFGRYTANLKVTYGTSHKVLTASLVFWVIPWKLIIVIIILLVGGFFILRYLLKRYNRYILKQANKSQRKK